jgi:hypothetical protein
MTGNFENFLQRVYGSRVHGSRGRNDQKWRKSRVAIFCDRFSQGVSPHPPGGIDFYSPQVC